ncbi:TAXI family TRAP transporter solute-binding subunit [Jiella avicenniae]|uniref:TAXI family TRAP transporter solute-binding subunit n=1 Tax=Jiella avicenniae TaxID=2907202 RepID=A0A9X1TDC6_9HYPH|nr:TAXI family TRAP transporter solute-binding subunit [Jiella avicenniae]MCE7029968.1 TAXI family TRAP transporter solute-binding subunit [Jiella avicenniae]
MLKHTVYGFTFVAALALAGTASAQSLGIGAGTQGSQNYAVNAGFAQFLSNELGLDVRVQAYGGSGQSMPLIDAGRLDLQLVPSPDVAAAVRGEEPFEGRPLQNLRAVASLSSSAYGFMVRADSDHTKVSDVKGLTITYGYTAQPTLRDQVDGILAAGGLSIDDMSVDNVPSVPNGVDDFIAGNADVAFFALQGGKTREADASVGIRWLAVENTPEAEAAMQKFVPTSYVKVVPAGSAPGVKEDTPMMGYDYVLAVGAHVPDETVRQILELVHDNPDKVRGILKTFAEFSPDEMAPDLKGIMYHPAASAYFKEIVLTK